MVTRSQFETLETRVFALESNVVSADNPDVKFLKAQLDKLDPAHKCMSLIGFKGTDSAARSQLIDSFLKAKFASYGDRLQVEHISKGTWQDRKLTSISLVEFPSKKARDDAVHAIKQGSWSLLEGSEPIRFGFAKTKKQLSRNYCVKKAVELLKRDQRTSGKEVAEEWKHAEKGKRTVSVAGQICFLQNASDTCGRFLPPFDNLHFE